MIELKGIGYVAGYARGRVLGTLGTGESAADRIVLLQQPTLDAIAKLVDDRPAAVILMNASQLAHTSIYVRSLGVPTVILDEHEQSLPVDNSTALVDGCRGRVIVDPDAATSNDWRTRVAREHNDDVPSDSTSRRIVTLDGVEVIIGASISSPAAASSALSNGADEIGMVRSEYLLHAAKDPWDVDSHIAVLREVCDAAGSVEVKVRLFDLGGDKTFSWLKSLDDWTRQPLGIRGSRVYEVDPFDRLLQAQVLAIDALSSQYNISMFAPYVSSVQEFRDLRYRVETIAKNRRLRVGAMLETPSVCLLTHEMAIYADYLALGTNDIMQCLFGADRSSLKTAKYLDPYSPSLWRFLRIVARSLPHNVPTHVCGQLTLFPYVAPILVGLGFRRFSVEAHAVSAIKDAIGRIDTITSEAVALEIARCDSSLRVKALLESGIRWHRRPRTRRAGGTTG